MTAPDVCSCGRAPENHPTMYRGVTRRGLYVTGYTPPGATSADFAEGKYRARWKRLTILRGGREVGGIYVTGRRNGTERTWWGER